MTVSIYVTWFHIIKGIERPLMLYSDIIQSYSYSTTFIKFIAYSLLLLNDRTCRDRLYASYTTNQRNDT